MGAFEPAFSKTMKSEGGYSNHPNDTGGETYKGITRRFHPAWEGWAIVDRLKLKDTFPACLDEHKELQVLVRTFYETEWFKKYKLDKIKSQRITEELFDSMMNIGPTNVTKWLQAAINTMSDKYNLAVDGKIGTQTVTALNSLTANQDIETCIYKLIDSAQAMHYQTCVLNNEKNRSFIKGWLLHRIDN